MIAVYILFGLYAAFITVLIYGWMRLPVPCRSDVDKSDDPFISVIVPIRNETSNIIGLLQDLEKQDCPREKFEVLLINDHSEDDTCQVVRAYGKNTNLNIRLIDLVEVTGKKQGITAGVKQAKGGVILQTDGDCRVGNQWVLTYMRAFSQSEKKMFFGPVCIQQSSFWAELQSIEFASLVGTGAATSFFRRITMLNGANMAFTKEVFNEVNGFEGNLEVPSGDDEFLAGKINALYPGSIQFLKRREVVVETKPVHSVGKWIMQRKRWAGKWNKGGNKVFAFSLFLFYMTVLLMVLAGAYGWLPVGLLFVLWAIKGVVDSLFIAVVMRFMKQRVNIFYLVLLDILYPFYSIIIGILSNFGKYSWKGREYDI
ncbi:MAG: glycosyltransferase [Cyclobacteriaceae bacterium]|nr:glycosyltransferase [Cyclobacteriaceae bacterium]